MTGIERALAEVVGDAHVLTAPDVTASYATDWTGRFRGATPAVVRPGSAGEVAAVLARCAAEGVAVVPQGGNTGLVGGGVPLAGEVVLSLRRLATIGPVDPLAAQVTAGAGATLAAVQRTARDEGLDVGVDLAARDSATIGGMVATNAGGLRVVRHGPMRAQVAGVEAVRSTGEVLSHLGGLAKDNTGYDLAGLLCGSEGTLAVVTAARLRLVPRYDQRVTALLAFPGVEPALAAAGAARHRLVDLDAAEVFFGDGLALVCDVTGLTPPFPDPHDTYLLLECAAHDDPADRLAAAVAGLADQPAAVAVGTDTATRARLWAYRESHTEAVQAGGPPVKLDVTLPAARLAAFVPAVRARVAGAAPGARCILFGHAADGNLHVNVMGASGPPSAVTDVEAAVLGLVAELGGSISAEHGIGTAKRAFLHLNRSPAELAAFAAIKHALDPAGILNPNALLPARA